MAYAYWASHPYHTVRLPNHRSPTKGTSAFRQKIWLLSASGPKNSQAPFLLFFRGLRLDRRSAGGGGGASNRICTHTTPRSKGRGFRILVEFNQRCIDDARGQMEMATDSRENARAMRLERRVIPGVLSFVFGIVMKGP